MVKVKNKKTFIFIAVIGLLIFLHFVKILSPVESLVIKVFKPFSVGFYSFGSSIGNYYKDQTDKRDLKKTNEQLENDVTKLTVDNAKLKLLEEENQTLRQYLKFLNKKEFSFVLGNIISRGDSSGQGQSIIIDKGTSQGIMPGMIAVGSFGTVIGKVVDVKDTITQISLITNPSCKIASTIQNINKTSGIIQGEMGLTVRMNFIPQSENIKNGDTVMTSGLEPNIPRGFVVGKIININKENNELWQSAQIEPLVDLNKLVIVSIILSQSK